MDRRLSKGILIRGKYTKNISLFLETFLLMFSLFFDLQELLQVHNTGMWSEETCGESSNRSKSCSNNI